MPREGERVKVLGSVRVSRRGGELQIEATTVLCEVSKGFWWQRFEETRCKLQAEGLFDPQRKRALPSFPERIGIVTSLDAAALRDMVRIARERHAGVEIVVFAAFVQGAEAPASLVRAIRLANSPAVAQAVGKLDVLIVGRGGGSIEDLWAFNEETVVRAVAESRIPTVSAVGHEVDVVLTDFAADWRAPTPTAAVQRVVPDRQELFNRLRQLDSRLQQAVRHRLRQLRERLLQFSERRCFADPLSLCGGFWQRLDDASMRLDAHAYQRIAVQRRRWMELAHRLVCCSPHAQLGQWRERLARYTERLQAAVAAAIERRHRTLAALAGKLEALSPYAVLQRGYALVRDPQTKRVLTRAAHLTVAHNAEVVMADGTLRITVNEVVKRDGSSTL
jgi:exodeoxyribonuclease VII large subunit